jgi:hypothetical protein
LSFDISFLVQDLDAVSSLAVITGVIFVVFQLRQNAKLIEASERELDTANRHVEAIIQQNKQQVILSVVDRFTDEAFIQMRKKVRETVKKYRLTDWEGYLESSDDYEVRGFLGHYDSTGYLAKVEIVDAKMVQEGMGFGVLTDWEALEPAIKFYRRTWKRKAFANFEWLMEQVKKGMEQDGINPATGAN